ncbi:thialysine N-epsilon-acetyltransferase-like [Candoia aspera]|uniref:thialysine N-epsilon-acetyltransferase-like n=1 Tax=Candoia aspera TaxID=51853 RepID=UPI002FD8218B
MLGDVVLPGRLPENRASERASRPGAAAAMDPPAAGVSVRACRAEDCADVGRMIRELAVFEKLPEQVKITDEGLCEDGFCQDPFYKCVVAELPPECRSKEGHTIIGYGLYFFTYSTWKGRNIYMEDLYVMPEFRGKGVGRKLLSEIAKIGLEKGCSQMRLGVLDWNRGAIDFYLRRGAVDLTATEGWHFFRFEAEALQQLALGEAGTGGGLRSSRAQGPASAGREAARGFLPGPQNLHRLTQD